MSNRRRHLVDIESGNWLIGKRVHITPLYGRSSLNALPERSTQEQSRANGHPFTDFRYVLIPHIGRESNACATQCRSGAGLRKQLRAAPPFSFRYELSPQSSSS